MSKKKKQKGSYFAAKERLAAETMNAKVDAGATVVVGAHVTRTSDGMPHLVIHEGSDMFMLLGLLQWALVNVSEAGNKMLEAGKPKEVIPVVEAKEEAAATEAKAAETVTTIP